MMHMLAGILWLLVAAGLAWLGWQHRRTLPSIGAEHPGDPACYRGLFYDNPRDRRLVVRELSGPGWTVNLAHRASAGLLVLMFGLPLAAAVLITLLHG